jgi:hypothetical protein
MESIYIGDTSTLPFSMPIVAVVKTVSSYISHMNEFSLSRFTTGT